MPTLVWVLLFISIAWVLAYQRASLKIWTISYLLFMVLHHRFAHISPLLRGIEAVVFIIIALILNLPALRQWLISRHLLKFYQRQMPTMSRTEREALEAGTTGWETELFGGQPDWQKLLQALPAKLTVEEQSFLDGPVEKLCEMTDDWEITHRRADLPPEVWQYIKEQGFFGLIIPKAYGGKEFSAYAHLMILVKLYGRSESMATTVSVPNSLGPAELLLHYGTESQKQYYLPRLARGEEIPCFALTNPEAGSDASSIPDTGIICQGEFEGKTITGIRLNWNKRYITLAPVATVLGLAFKLYDPEQRLGNTRDLGITCALIPVSTPGIQIGRRHFPLNAGFQNGPTQGKDVFIPLDWIIGGIAMAGRGWQMLVECLATGRAISLPSTALGGSKKIVRATGAYARIRKQFNLPIGQFEGVQEALARMGGHAYLLDAAIKYTVATIDQGNKPAVASAIMKYHATERGRIIINAAMDIHGGRGICLGPKNYLARNYQATPIGITVEGANILTRSLIIFGQGALRCHPYLQAELHSAQDENQARGLKMFDKALFGHIGYSISAIVRAITLALTAGRLVIVPTSAHDKRYFQLYTRYSAAFALVAEVTIITLGANLKRKESLSARLGDILSLLYMGTTVLKHHIDQNQPEADRPLVEWVSQDLLFTIEAKFAGLFANLPNRWLAGLLKTLTFPFGMQRNEPSDKLNQRIAALLMAPTESRARLTAGAYVADHPNNNLAILEQALYAVISAEPLEKRLHEAVKKNNLSALSLPEQVQAVANLNILSAHEAEQILAADTARKTVIAVDDFAPNELTHGETIK